MELALSAPFNGCRGELEAKVVGSSREGKWIVLIGKEDREWRNVISRSFEPGDDRAPIRRTVTGDR